MSKQHGRYLSDFYCLFNSMLRIAFDADSVVRSSVHSVGLYSKGTTDLLPHVDIELASGAERKSDDYQPQELYKRDMVFRDVKSCLIRD